MKRRGSTAAKTDKSAAKSNRADDARKLKVTRLQYTHNHNDRSTVAQSDVLLAEGGARC
jgi:hypothetical protein